ncbi:MAG: CpsD/CapB family tyrosine-protein kinase [Steroidobacteraceae bacterium]
MSSEPETIDPPLPDPDEELARSLVLLHRLSNEAIEQINDLMKRLHIRFAEAALQSGAVTQPELDEALLWVDAHPSSSRRGSGLIEEVLKRTARQRRDPVLWEHDQLEPAQQLVLAHQPDHAHSEIVRSLRTELLLRCKGQRGAGMMALLSPCNGEGRSHLAAELAIAFAQLDRRTLLVDADMRNPVQHRLFATDNEIGLAQALTEGGPQHFHGIKGLPQMALVTSGDVPRNPLELLSGRNFERTMTEWRRNFEFVILDTPASTRFSDALAIAATAGNVLLLGRAETTRFTDLSEISRNLASTRSRILGAVINRF